MVFAKHYYVDEMKRNELDGACSTQGEGGEMRTRFWWGNLKERPLGRHRHRWEYNTEMKF